MKTFDINPLTAKERRKLRTPSALVWKTYYAYVMRMMGFVCLIACLMFTGCNLTSTIGMGPEKRQNVPATKEVHGTYEGAGLTNIDVELAQADNTNHFCWLPDLAFSPIAPLEVTLRTLLPNDPNDCGPCNTNPTVQYVLGPHTTRLAWKQAGFCRGWYFWESKDLAKWVLVDTVLSYGNQDVAYSRLTTNNPVYWKVSAY